ncbi:hypothetical protein F400_gp138 [Bacillus phage BCD7]|uniref:Uncharacterized protein n=1 Tax=Bacillus phage BCD7 TaxID=1136534 RepID=J9PVD6_9CAUD|nr:hypothetical protein F400_gp138 [Bacillus phage BCD7]AEZ50585.1 hypothetical protein BCD7_0138 [Bacillus phage BCD7]
MTLFENYPTYMERLLNTLTRKMELTQVNVQDSETKAGVEVITITAKYKTVVREITLKCFESFTSVYVSYSQYDLFLAMIHNLESTDGKHYFHWEEANLKIRRNAEPENVERYEKTAGESFQILNKADILVFEKEEQEVTQ